MSVSLLLVVLTWTVSIAVSTKEPNITLLTIGNPQATHNPENVRSTWNTCRDHPLLKPLIYLKKPRLASAKTGSEEVTASCVVKAAPNTRVSWVLNGKQRDGTHTAVDNPGNKTQLITSTLTLSVTEWEKEQRLACRVKQPCSKEHEEAVNVLEPVDKTPTVEIRRSLADVLKGVSAVLECSARDLPSGEFSVAFQANGHQIHEEYVKVSKSQSTVTTRVNIPTIYQTKDYNFTCEVQQSPSKYWQSDSTGDIFGEPSVELLMVSNTEKAESQILLCYGTGFYPKITWNPTSVQMSSNTMMQADGRVTVSSQIRVPSQHCNKRVEYTCQVNDLGNPVKKSISVCTSLAMFSLKINPPSAKDLFVRNKATITCVVTGDNKNEVDGAIVSWTVGGSRRESSGTDNVKQTTPPFTKTSSLTLDQSEWFSGSEVECFTEREKTPFSDKIKVKKGGKPSIVFYKPEKDVKDTDTVSLLCEVRSSDLGDVYVMWKMNNGQYMEGSSTVHINEKNTAVVLSYLTVSGKVYNSAQFTCAFKDANMEWGFIPNAERVTTSKINCPIHPVLEHR